MDASNGSDTIEVMTTTIEIPDDLFRAAESRAAEQGVPLHQVVEEALRDQLEKDSPGKPFRLEDGSFDGGGLQEGVTWDRLLDYAL